MKTKEMGYLMGLFTQKIGAVFLKETSDVKEYIEKMEKLKKYAPDEIRKKIEKQVSYAKYGEGKLRVI